MRTASANSDSHLHKLVSYDGQFSSIISNSIRVSRHIALRHRKESKYRCDKCLRVFRNATSLTQHNFKIHGVDNPKLKVRCIIVRTRYQSNMLLIIAVSSAIKIQQKTNVHVQVLRELVASTANYVIRLSDILLFFIMVHTLSYAVYVRVLKINAIIVSGTWYSSVFSFSHGMTRT